MAAGFAETALRLRNDVIPFPTKDTQILFGSGFTFVRDGIATQYVLVGNEEHLRKQTYHAWRALGLTPISSTSELGRAVFTKKVGDVVHDGKNATYVVSQVFIPDTSGATIYTPPEAVSSISRRFA
jgi:transcription elongation GreA/GreB family factor